MKISLFLYSLIYLCASLCCGDDGSDYEYLIYDVPELVEVEENINQYQLNDTLYIEIKIPRVVTTTTSEIIDIPEITGNGQVCYVDFSVYNLTNFDTPQPLVLSQNEIIDFGNQIELYDERIGVEVKLNDAFYEARLGLILKEVGDFYLKGNRYNSNNKVQINFRSNNQVSLDINSTIVGANEENLFLFEVN